MKEKVSMLKLLFVSLVIGGTLNFSIAQNSFPKDIGTVVFESKEDPIKKKVASPSIVILANGDYLISHDYNRGTSVHLSKDRGKTWKELSRVSPLIWANLFEHQGQVYLMGTTKGWGHIVIYRSKDGGKTWSVPVDENTGILAKGLFHTGPVPIVKHNNKIWRAYEEVFDIDNKRDFRAFAIAADQNADLLKASSWTRTNSLRFEETWLNAKRPNWLEGNIVVTPEGKLVDFMRLETWGGKGVKYDIEGAAQGKPRDEVAAIITIDDQKMKMAFENETKNFVHFPGAESKFTIRYDSISKLYWTISNKISSFKDTEETYNGNWHQRNVLVLMSSKDLQHWEIRKKILRYNEGAHLRTWDTFGFQYVDWVFDQQDIAFVSRTSWYGYRYHDANMITFHRISNFRASKSLDEPEDMKKYTQHPNLVQIPADKLIKQEHRVGDFKFKIDVGSGLTQSSPGLFYILKPEKIAKNYEQTGKLERYFDLHIENGKMNAFSLESLDYTPATNGDQVKLKWEYSIDGGKTFLPITNYYIPVENAPEEEVAEPRLFLHVYQDLRRISGAEGVTIRCHVISMNKKPVYLQFKGGIAFGGRKL